MTQLPKQTLRVGFVGSGFIAHFHLKSMIGVRNVEVTGVFSRKAENREKFANEVESSVSAPAARMRVWKRC